MFTCRIHRSPSSLAPVKIGISSTSKTQPVWNNYQWAKYFLVLQNWCYFIVKKDAASCIGKSTQIVSIKNFSYFDLDVHFDDNIDHLPSHVQLFKYTFWWQWWHSMDLHQPTLPSRHLKWQLWQLYKTNWSYFELNIPFPIHCRLITLITT